METLEKMKELAEKATLTKEDRETIVAQCNELSIEFTPSTRCKNCYHDAALQCAIKMREAGGGAFGLKPGIDVLINGRRLNAATITEEWFIELNEKMPQWWIETYFNIPTENED